MKAKSLNDIIFAMDSPRDFYLEPATMQIYSQSESHQLSASIKLLQIPQSDEISLIRKYMQNSAYFTDTSRFRQLISLCNTDILSGKEQSELLHKFHVYVNDFNLYDDWIKFRSEQLLETAKIWCKEHNVYFQC